MKKPQGVSDETWNNLLKSSIFNRLPNTEFLVKVENEFKINSWEKYETYHFDIEDNFGNLYNVTWNKDTHNEGQNNFTSFRIFEFEITDEGGEFLENDSDEFETIVNLIKQNKFI
jgi:hypothetical protein